MLVISKSVRRFCMTELNDKVLEASLALESYSSATIPYGCDIFIEHLGVTFSLAIDADLV